MYECGLVTKGSRTTFWNDKITKENYLSVPRRRRFSVFTFVWCNVLYWIVSLRYVWFSVATMWNWLICFLTFPDLFEVTLVQKFQTFKVFRICSLGSVNLKCRLLGVSVNDNCWLLQFKNAELFGFSEFTILNMSPFENA